MSGLKAKAKQVKGIITQERKIYIREIGKKEKSYHKYKLSNDYIVQ